MAISLPFDGRPYDLDFAFMYGEIRSVVSCTMPSRASPSVISAASIAAPLSLSPDARQSPLHELPATARAPRSARFRVEVPLQVTDEPRTIIDHGEQVGCRSTQPRGVSTFSDP